MSVNPFYQNRNSHQRTTYHAPQLPQASIYAKLPCAPITGSPVPHLTSLHHNAERGPYGDSGYPGNCGGYLIKDLLSYFRPGSVFDPMTGSGTCRDVCKELNIPCFASDMRTGVDACDASQFPRDAFDFAWLHPPYWRQKLYTDDPRDLSRAPTLTAFLNRYRLLIENCARAITAGGKLAILMGDYCDREEGFVSLVYWTKHLARACGLRPHCTDIIRFSHGASSSRKVYTSSFIPGLHDVCMIFER